VSATVEGEGNGRRGEPFMPPTFLADESFGFHFVRPLTPFYGVGNRGDRGKITNGTHLCTKI
jgi:hypothetical protein